MSRVSIKPVGPLAGEVSVPRSKSMANRALVCASATSGTTRLVHPPSALDSRVLRAALQACGVPIREEEDAWVVQGLGGAPQGLKGCFDVGEAGTAARFLAPFLAAGSGDFRLDGAPRMRERPMRDLFHALIELGASVEPEDRSGNLPWRVRTSGLHGTAVRLRGGVSSQFISGLLMCAPLLQTGALELVLIGEVRSWPYVEMTRQVMADFGVNVIVDGERLIVPSGQGYRSPGEWEVEVDASGAAFFLAAAAIAGGRVLVPGLHQGSVQGDVRMVACLERMGARARWSERGVELEGPCSAPLEEDLRDVPDLVLPLAAVAALVPGESVFRCVGHLRVKESDRLQSLANELPRLGVEVVAGEEELRIRGPARHGALLQSHGDHRVAMALSILGLALEGIQVAEPGCVAKSMPEFYDLLDTLAPGCVAERIDA